MSFSRTKKVNLEEAKSFAHFWKDLPVPIHPSSEETKSWLPKIREITKRKNPQGLILGATPEYRDLFSRFKIKTTLIDISPFIIRAMGYLVKKSVKEKIVIGDWLKMPFKDNSFDLVISDSAQDNIKLNDFNKFFRNVNRILKPNGYWFFGASLPGDEDEPLSLAGLLKLYKTHPRKFINPQDKLYYYCRASIHPRFYNRKARMCSWRKLDKALEKEYKKDVISKKDLKKLQVGTDKWGKFLAATFPWLPFKELFKIINPYFKLIYRFKNTKHPFNRFHQAFILKPRK